MCQDFVEATTSDADPSGLLHVLTAAKLLGPVPFFNGAFTWDISWKLKKPSKVGGYVIQDITWYWSITDKNGKDVPFLNPIKRFDNPLHYWEAWRVDPGQKLTTPQTDSWYIKQPGYPNTKGFIMITATAWFFEGYALPNHFIVPNQKTMAGAIRSTTKNPGLPLADSNGVSRSILVCWNSLKGNGNSKTVIVPILTPLV